MAIILKSLELFGYLNIACGVFRVNNQIIIFELGIYLCQIVVFMTINFFVWIYMCKQKPTTLNKQANHQISQANFKTSREIKPNHFNINH
jgi:hypothetical protein